MEVLCFYRETYGESGDHTLDCTHGQYGMVRGKEHKSVKVTVLLDHGEAYEEGP